MRPRRLEFGTGRNGRLGMAGSWAQMENRTLVSRGFDLWFLLARRETMSALEPFSWSNFLLYILPHPHPHATPYNPRLEMLMFIPYLRVISSDECTRSPHRLPIVVYIPTTGIPLSKIQHLKISTSTTSAHPFSRGLALAIHYFKVFDPHLSDP